MDNNVKNLFLALVGGASLSYDKAKEILDQMVARGRVNVEDGKQLTEDLKRTFKREPVSDPDRLAAAELTEELLSLRQDVNQLQSEVRQLRDQWMASQDQDSEDA